MSKVLVVEDDEMLRKVYTHILEKENFEVASAATGKDALEQADSFQPDLIILDILMPEMDGLEFLRQYDVRNKHPEVKVIVFSNLASTQRINEAVELGAVNYKTKALFSPKEMIELIRTTLQQPTE